MARTILQRAWYGDTIPSFLRTEEDRILGRIASRTSAEMVLAQRDAWMREICVLKRSLSGLDGRVYLEFEIPRMGRRIDTVLLINGIVLVVEFKIGENYYYRHALDQVCDYALDLKYFHKGSHDAAVVPILVATDAPAVGCALAAHGRVAGLYHPIRTNESGLKDRLHQIVSQVSGNWIDPDSWENAPYQPTPTVIEAARALFNNHSVADIARHDAGAQNLTRTTGQVESIIEDCAARKRKAICFVTGVPGAGKTLVGLSLAARRSDPQLDQHTVFLSGNGPLVAILQEALTRDAHQRQKQSGKAVTKGEIRARVKSFIQNVHHFRDEAVRDPDNPPHDHVAVFDEAQRAWNYEKTCQFMRQKKGVPNFNCSEPEFLIRTMDRHREWAVVVCLVGGGQEINTGEAGIGAWLESACRSFPDWQICLAPEFTDPEFGAESLKPILRESRQVQWCDDLHLNVSMRSFRAEKVSGFVNALLDLDANRVRQYADQILDRYPMFITRDLDCAKEWVRQQAYGAERYGMVASSQAERLKPYAIDVRYAIDPVQWFLNEKDDVRSSYYLEDAASEFDIQGLELDWNLVAWDGDFRCGDGEWGHFQFRGSRWEKIRKEERRKYQKNAYRVLLTRARQGMVIFVPPGNRNDPTRDPDFYDGTWQYLRSAGLPVL